MSTITATLVSGQTAVVGVASSREAYEIEVSSGIAGASGVSVVSANVVGGMLNLTLSNSAVVNAGSVMASANTGTITFTGNTIGQFNNNSINVVTNGKEWTFGMDGLFSIPGGIYANGSTGSNGQVLTSTGTSVRWANVAAVSQVDLTAVASNIVPTANLTYNLGSPTKKWHSLYVGSGSVYIGDAKLSLEGGKLSSNVGFATDSLSVGNVDITVNGNGALVSSGGFVGGVADTGDITFTASTMAGGANADLIIQTNWDSPSASPAVNNVSSSWVFGKNQTLTFPDSTVQTTAYTGTAAGLPGWNVDAGNHFIPASDNLQDIGTPTQRVRHVYVGPGSVTIGNSVITESTTGKLVLPGVTRATTLFADEIEDEDDQTYEFSSIPIVIDAYEYGVRSGAETPPVDYVAAEYIVGQLDDDGYLEDIEVDVSGTWTQAIATANRNNSMFAYIGSDINESFNDAHWVSIPFSVRAKANDVEYEFGGDSASNLDELNDVEISDLQNGQALVWDDNDEKWKNQIVSGNANTGDITFSGTLISTAEDSAIAIRKAGGDDDNQVVLNNKTVEVYAYNDDDNTWAELLLNNENTASPFADIWVKGTGDTEKVWRFKHDGNLTLPEGGDIVDINGDSVLGGGGGSSFTVDTVNLHNGGNQTAQILQFTDNQYQAVITGPTPTEGRDAQRLIIQGQNGGTGEGGDVYLWGGDADTDGGDIKIYAGDADNNDPEANTGEGGYINIQAGRGYAQGGHVYIDSGYSAGGTGGNVRITAAPGSAGNGSIQFLTSNGLKQWDFSYNGDFNIPEGGDIKRGGVSVLGESGYSLPVASANTLGGVIIGDGINVDSNGMISVTATTAVVEYSDTAPDTDVLWFNTVEARTYIKYNDQWVDASPTVLAPPDDTPTFESVTFNDNTVQTTAWLGAPAFVGGGGANTWLTAE